MRVNWNSRSFCQGWTHKKIAVAFDAWLDRVHQYGRHRLICGRIINVWRHRCAFEALQKWMVCSMLFAHLEHACAQYACVVDSVCLICMSEPVLKVGLCSILPLSAMMY